MMVSKRHIIYHQSGEVFVNFDEDDIPSFPNPSSLTEDIIKNGISIPPWLKKEFDGKSRICPILGSKDEINHLFRRAMEYYFKNELSKHGYYID